MISSEHIHYDHPKWSFFEIKKLLKSIKISMHEAMDFCSALCVFLIASRMSMGFAFRSFPSFPLLGRRQSSAMRRDAL